MTKQTETCRCGLPTCVCGFKPKLVEVMCSGCWQMFWMNREHWLCTDPVLSRYSCSKECLDEVLNYFPEEE